MRIQFAHRFIINSVPRSRLDKLNVGSLMKEAGPLDLHSAYNDLCSLDQRMLKKAYRRYRLADNSPVVKKPVPEPKGEQVKVLESIRRWLKGPEQIFRLYGSAGTGKSTVGAMASDIMGHNVLWTAPTGKAAQNMRLKGMDCQTLHSAIYTPIQDSGTGKVQYLPRPVLEANAVVVDEALMVGTENGAHLADYGLKILAIGDPGQLPPIEGPPFFFAEQPEALLTTVHRTARNNPVIQLAHRVRRGDRLEVGVHRTESGKVEVRPSDWFQSRRDELIMRHTEADSVILCGTNNTRNAINARARRLLGFHGKPRPGETLICLKNKLPFVNGGLWHVLGCSEPRVEEVTYTRMVSGMPVSAVSYWTEHDGMGVPNTPVTCEVVDLWLMSADIPNSLPVHVVVPWACFTNQRLHWKQESSYTSFTFGYCLTVHKAQGSEFKNVLVIDESHVFRSSAIQHRYTAVTRTKENLTIIV